MSAHEKMCVQLFIRKALFYSKQILFYGSTIMNNDEVVDVVLQMTIRSCALWKMYISPVKTYNMTKFKVEKINNYHQSMGKQDKLMAPGVKLIQQIPIV